MQNSLAEAIFGRAIHDLRLSDIENYFKSGQRETDSIEFKSYVDYSNQGDTKTTRDKEKINDIKRTLCAFLNSDGGLLIWGAPAGMSVAGNNEKVFQGPLTEVDVKIEPDQFINMVAAEISPIPLRTLFLAIEISAGKYCYVFEVKRSDYAPHQFKGTYYMRLDGSTRSAPHHYVEALIKKVSYPKLEAYISFGKMQSFTNTVGIPAQITIHNLSKSLNERDVCFRVVAVGGAMIDPFKMQNSNLNSNGVDIHREARDILLYSMPFFTEYLIVVPRNNRELPKEFHIVLTVWGMTSPVVCSDYKLRIWPMGPEFRYEIEKNENFYLRDALPEIDDKKKLDNSRTQIMESYEQRLSEFPIHYFMKMSF